MNLFYQPLIPDNVLHLDEEESRHCTKVLRNKAGDIIHITDGKGRIYQAKLTNADPRKSTFTIEGSRQTPPREFQVHIAISPTKNADRIEWFAEKATEIGIETISLIDCDHTERSFIKADRIRKVVVSAMKQSLKSYLPEVNDLVPFSAFLQRVRADEKFLAFVDSSNPLALQQAAHKGRSVVVLIGPEGDFSNEEVDMAINSGFIKVGLGPSRLRTETAGIAACHILNLLNSEHPINFG